MFQRFKSPGQQSPNPPPVPEEAPEIRLALPAVVDPDAVRGPDLLDLKVRIHQQLIDMVNLSAVEEMSEDELKVELGDIIRELLARDQVPLNQREKAQLTTEVIHEIVGFGPLEPLLKDTTISDIVVNTYKQVIVERAGRLQPTNVRFKDDRHLLRIINKIVAAVGRRVDEAQPLVDARLADGSRVNAVIPPIAVDGPLLSIRKFSHKPFGMPELVDVGTITKEMSDVLQAIVAGRLNVIISGGTGSGKTTLLNAMSSAIDHRERIVTIEDAAELQLQQPHVARMETRPSNIEGKGEITQRDLVRNALRMRPDRIILGEVRAAEAFDMLQAMNTGHDGSMSTVHANTCRDALSRLEMMISMAGFDMPVRAIRAQIASAIQVVVQLERMTDGRRRITSIHEITGMEGDILQMQEIFRFQRKTTTARGVVGDYWASGIRPKFCTDLAQKGITLPPNYFSGDKPLGESHGQ